ncbi:sodium-dependent transporter [candidate division KSB1 bacterium]|nr:sodium-dependent transporter [candidate division KSB1 bacterium]NIR72141.1 sodium-dependent transporter [candidate division KSB1 bacterium]NIS26606.1 sodium-dependent transporter [candidate division KSB1 bacterium]NIT73374.1 sodium-dependent transporter [candidate division KSB1 bacterium]NIU27222.1 sodium-dependent transporter [candidate division KSB1 bacterium]
MITNGSERGLWSSKLGFILAGAGSAVGLGNIWRFPTTAGQYGGGAFVFVYLASVIFICLAVMIAELTLGRHTERNPVGVYKALAPGTAWKYLGLLGVITGWGIASFYSVIAGWTLGYLFKTATGAFSGLSPAQITGEFTSFTSNHVATIGLHGVFMLITMSILFGGVKGGIERWSKILMPVLLIILILLVVRAVTLEGGGKGLAFYLKPNLENVSLKSIAAAMGQAFFSLSLGMGTMITYGSYLSKKDNLISSASWVVTLDTSIALLAGFAIMPAIFAFGLNPQSGPGLIFIVLPNMFNKILLGNLFGAGFFLLLAVAAVTSLISIVEVPAAYFIDELKFSRKRAVWIAGGGAFLAGIPAALYGNFLGWMNKIFGQYSLIIGSLGVALFVGWKWGTAKVEAEIRDGNPDFQNAKTYAFFIRFFAPVSILALLIFLVLFPGLF